VQDKDNESIDARLYTMKYIEVHDFRYQVICKSTEKVLNTLLLGRIPGGISRGGVGKTNLTKSCTGKRWFREAVPGDMQA
jgi:hypothetical protein